MKNSFTAAKNQRATRNFGGTRIGIAEPYVTGYHHIYFEMLPPQLSVPVNGGETAAGTIKDVDIRDLLAASCLSVTPPGGTLNKISFTGMGGTKWAVPGSIDYGDSVSIKFLEFSGLPISQIFHEWTKMIRDYRTGVSSKLIAGNDRKGYSKAEYASTMYYWTTAPDGKTVEYYACYTGVFPTKDPQDLFASDVENVGKIEPEIEFNVDYMWHEPWVLEKCRNYSHIDSDLIMALYKDPSSGSN